MRKSPRTWTEGQKRAMVKEFLSARQHRGGGVKVLKAHNLTGSVMYQWIKHLSPANMKVAKEQATKAFKHKTPPAAKRQILLTRGKAPRLTVQDLFKLDGPDYASGLKQSISNRIRYHMAAAEHLSNTLKQLNQPVKI